MIGKDCHVQYSDRIIVIIRAGFSCQTIPFTSQIHTKFMQFCRMVNFCTHIFHFKMNFQFFQQLSISQAIQIFYNPIVINNFQLMIRKMYSHEKVIFFISGMLRILCLIFGTDTCRSSCPMMPVCHISVRNLSSKQFFKASIRFRTINRPEMMPETIFCHKVIICLLVFNNIFHNGIYLGNSTVSKKYRLQIRIYITG